MKVRTGVVRNNEGQPGLPDSGRWDWSIEIETKSCFGEVHIYMYSPTPNLPLGRRAWLEMRGKK